MAGVGCSEPTLAEPGGDGGMGGDGGAGGPGAGGNGGPSIGVVLLATGSLAVADEGQGVTVANPAPGGASDGRPGLAGISDVLRRAGQP
jgi:hypothetical protein